MDDLLHRVARSRVNVLVLGETGAGKEVLAERLHRIAGGDRPLVKLNCAALTESLFASELFGHERGAFTGAVDTKRGLLELAPGGTVFLDEIGDLPLGMQVKLLRVIEERAIVRVGGVVRIAIDARFIAATHRDLDAEVARGGFRQDLLFRLDGITLRVPPLRARRDDIARLAAAFAREAGGPPPSAAALAVLVAHPWPGNVRELRHVIERAVLVGDGDAIEPHHLIGLQRSAPIAADVADELARLRDEIAATRDRLAALERSWIAAAIARCAGNQTAAARLLGVPRRTLVRWLAETGLPRPRATGSAGSTACR